MSFKVDICYKLKLSLHIIRHHAI